MTDRMHEVAAKSDATRQAKTPYRSPRLEILGSLRSATHGSGGKGADGALGMTMMSDRRVKEVICRIGEHPLGIGVYLFRYKPPHTELYGIGRRVGVMADEVAEKYPDAVSRESAGYFMVDYGRLFGSSLAVNRVGPTCQPDSRHGLAGTGRPAFPR